MHYLFSRPDSLAEKAKQLLEKVSTEESIQRGDNVHIKLEESTKVEKLSDLSDDEKARIEDVLSRRDKNMPDGMKNRKRHPILMFDKNGQYHGSYASVSDAEEKIKRVGDTEGWINGPRLVQVDESTELTEGKKVSSLVWGVFAQTLLSKVEPKEVKKAQELLKTWGKQKDKFTDKDIADLIDKLKTPPKPKDGYFFFAIDEIGKIAAAYDEPKADWYKNVPELKKSANLSDAEKLKIFADNNKDLYDRSAVPVMQNLTRKFKKGIYDHELAKKLWKYHSDRAAKAYGKEHGNDGFAIFSPAIRKEVAAEFADDFQVELEDGNFHEGVSVQKMLDAEDRETGKFHSMSDMTLAFDENPEGSTSQLGDGVMELDGFNAAGWQHLDGKYAVRVGGGYMIYTDFEAAKAYAKDDFEEGYKKKN